ncbi:putative RNA exonuclease NEF-sp-like [Homarus americanus]|uniref:Putative RNA exonuclease NEF-sp-like n=2 Tax=Homarus americanus TaxID=6706 RepID=A0A8J5JFL0_HOMAM|nr:putative RNA exonuclease NEF-sp-like [Homarus americanus]
MSLIGKKVSHLEVLSCNKELSLKAAEVSMNVDFTYVHMQMNTKLRQNQAPETRQHHFKKLDKQLQRLYNGAAAKALILYIFSGSSLDVAAEQRANGFVMFAIKGQPYAI